MNHTVEDVRILPVIEYAVHRARARVRDKDITILSKSYRCQRISVHMDSAQLQQILINLLSNAVVNSTAGGTVLLSCVGAMNNRIRISITDTGPGHSEEELKSLFTPTSRDNIESGRTEASGTGLSLSKDLVESLGGVLSACSTPGDGTTFWIELPYILSEVDT
jgi:signal transduction histidine kinase